VATAAADFRATFIQSLEDWLGVRLLDRITRKVSLTEVGQSYYERCVQILVDMEDADRIAEALQVRPRGLLRVNAAPPIPNIIASSRFASW
jgi:DNA-binding transcriptional LysR family regulator